jgi:hypothetical protein
VPGTSIGPGTSPTISRKLIAMTLRVEGTAAECEQATRQLAEVLDVLSVSDPYPSRNPVVLTRAETEQIWHRGVRWRRTACARSRHRHYRPHAKQVIDPVLAESVSWLEGAGSP